MNNFNYKNMTPFKWFVLENFPFIENDFEAINNYRLFSKVVEYLNKTIDSMNLTGEQMENVTNAMTELQDYVNNLVLQDEVNNKLDEMVQNGTFETILNNFSIGKETFRSRLYMSKIGRLNFTDYINNGYANMQAGCYVGNNQYIFPLIKNDSLGTARIFKIDFTTGMILDYRDLTGIFHANGSCIKNDKIYFTQTFDDEHTDKFGVVEVDINTLEITNIYEINFNNMSVNETILAIGYDEKYNKFYLIARNYFYRCNENFEVEQAISMEKPNYKNLIRQGGTFYNDYVCYVVNNENAIVCMNRDGTIHHIIDIGYQQDGNFFGEIENINVYNNTLYFNSVQYHSTQLYLFQFFKASLQGGGLPQTIATNTTFNNNVILTAVVNKTKYNTLTDFGKFTSDGSSDKPFETIAEALSSLDNNFIYNIEVQDTNNYLEDLAIYNKNIQLKCNGSKIGSIKAVASKLSISNAEFYKASYRTPIFGTDPNYITPLYITGGSNVWLTGNIGYNKAKCINDGMIYPCIIEGSNLFDGSSGYDTGINKFTTTIIEDDVTYEPLIKNAIIHTNNAFNVKNNITHFTHYSDNTDYTNTILYDLTPTPHTNQYRGLWISIYSSTFYTNYEHFDAYRPNGFIIREDPDNNTKYGFKITYTGNTNQIRATMYKWNTNTKLWERDQTTAFKLHFMFEI